MRAHPLPDRFDSDDVDVLRQILEVASRVHDAQGRRETLERLIDGALDVVDDQPGLATARVPQESGFPGGLRDLVIEPILERFPHEIIPRLVKRLAGARSFRGAEALMSPLVSHFDRFNDDEISAFATASIENGQIWDAEMCATDFLPEFLRKHRATLPSDKLAALEYQINNRRRYHLRENAEPNIGPDGD